MKQESTDQHEKSTPWISASCSLFAALAGAGCLLSQFVTLMGKARDGVAEAELTNEFMGGVWLPIALLVTALLAGIVNVILVVKGGRKWTLLPSLIGILTSLLALAFLAITWMNQNG